MNIPINALIHCTDGDFGHSTCLVINPITDVVTHFVARNHLLIGEEHLISVSFIVSTTNDSITVNCDRETLAKQPDFITYEFEVPEGVDPDSLEYMYWPMMLPEDGRMPAGSYYPMIAEKHIPAGELAVRRSMAVMTAADPTDVEHPKPLHIGNVVSFLAESENGHITHLLVREGCLWGKRDVTIPVSAVTQIEEGAVHLKLTRNEVKALPAVPVKHWRPFAQ